jgi:hypothetical protein
MNNIIERTNFIKTVYVLPEDTVIAFYLWGQAEGNSVMATLKYLENGYAARIDGFYVTNAINEEILKSRSDTAAVQINFYQSKDQMEYETAATKAQEAYHLLTEFLFSYKEGMQFLIAGGKIVDGPEEDNSINFNQIFKVIKIAVLVDKKEEAEVINIIYTLNNDDY